MIWWYAVARVRSSRHRQSRVCSPPPECKQPCQKQKGLGTVRAVLSFSHYRALPPPTCLASRCSVSQTGLLDTTTKTSRRLHTLSSGHCHPLVHTRALRRLILLAPRPPSSNAARREIHTQPPQDSKPPQSSVSDGPLSRSMVNFLYTHSSGPAASQQEMATDVLGTIHQGRGWEKEAYQTLEEEEKIRR